VDEILDDRCYRLERYSAANNDMSAVQTEPEILQIAHCIPVDGYFYLNIYTQARDATDAVT